MQIPYFILVTLPPHSCLTLRVISTTT